MTTQAKRLLRKLIKAQETEDGQIYIDFAEMTVSTVHTEGSKFTTVKLKRYKNSIQSTLSYLKNLGYIAYDDFGQAKVLHTGWHASDTTVQTAVKFTVRDIILPILVTIVTTLLLRLI